MTREQMLAWAKANAGKYVRARHAQPYDPPLGRVSGYNISGTGIWRAHVLVSDESQHTAPIQEGRNFVALYPGATIGCYYHPDELIVSNQNNMRVTQGLEALERTEKAIKQTAIR